MSQKKSHTNEGAPDGPAQGTVSVWRTVWEWTKSIGLAVGIAMLIRWPVAEPFKIPSGSMEPTLHGDAAAFRGDRIFVNKHAYGIRFPFNGFRIPFTKRDIWYTDKWLWKGPLPDRWDIVVFKAVEPGVVHHTLVKRVVALAGEQVLIRDGKLYIDGEPMALPESMPDVYYTRETRSNGYGLIPDEMHSVVPEGCVFMMGDNSSRSRDGRWFGFVPHDHLLGEVTSIWFPIGHWRDFSGFTSSLWWRGGWFLAALYLVVRLFFGRSVTVYSSGLAGLVRRGEKLMIRFSFGLPIPFSRLRVGRGAEPQRGELVLYRPPEGVQGPEMLLGIVAGLPTEKVQIVEGRLHVNGEPVAGPKALSELRFTQNGHGGRYGVSRGKEYSVVPADHMFLLSDGDDSPDSRALGWIPRGQIVGTARAVWWPPVKVRKIGASSDGSG